MVTFIDEWRRKFPSCMVVKWLITCDKNYKNEIKPSATTDTDGVYQLSSKQLLA